MSDDSSDSAPLRRRVLEAVATSGVAVGVSGCLSFLDDGSDERPPGGDAPTSGNTPTSDESTAPDGEGSSRDWKNRGNSLIPTGPSVELEKVASWVGLPTGLAASDDHMFVTVREGLVFRFDPRSRSIIHRRDGVLDRVLDLTDRVVEGYETGLLGIALHPEFEENGRLFVRYSVPPGDDPPDGYDDHVERLSEFRTTDDGRRADPDSERVLLAVPQPAARHNSGEVAFGPDGYLYLAFGDGGEETMAHPPGWDRGGPSQNTQDNLLGSVLRIDVDEQSSSARQTVPDGIDLEGEGRPYGIPPDNPLVDRPGHLDELYAWGLRNPWGMTFDGDDLYVADAGAHVAESVYRVEKGGNYGWAVREGSGCYNDIDPTDPLDDCPDRTPDSVRGGEPLRDPVVEYPHAYEETEMPSPGEAPPEDAGRPYTHEEHSIATAVVGGGVYRGDAVPGLQGKYVFADWLSPMAPDESGALLAASPLDGKEGHSYYRDRDVWPVQLLGYDYGEMEEITGFGTDSRGELYVLSGNGIFRLAASE